MFLTLENIVSTFEIFNFIFQLKIVPSILRNIQHVSKLLISLIHLNVLVSYFFLQKAIDDILIFVLNATSYTSKNATSIPFLGAWKVPLCNTQYTFFLYNVVVPIQNTNSEFHSCQTPIFVNVHTTCIFFSPFFTKINCIYRLNMILLHFPKAQIMSSHAIRNNLWLIYFFQARRRH